MQRTCKRVLSSASVKAMCFSTDVKTSSPHIRFYGLSRYAVLTKGLKEKNGISSVEASTSGRKA